MSFHRHNLQLVQNPIQIGQFLGDSLGYVFTPAESYAQDISQLEKQVHLILTEMPHEFDEDVEEVEYLLNVGRSCVFGVCCAQSTTPPEGYRYDVIQHCIAILAIEQAIGNIEDWIKWAAEEFKVDLSVTVH